MTNAEFCQSIHVITYLIATQAEWDAFGVLSAEAIRVTNL